MLYFYLPVLGTWVCNSCSSLSYILKDLFAVGAVVSGWLADYYVIKGKKQRGGTWEPEDRLKAALPNIAFFTTISVLGYGFTTEYIRGWQGIALNLIWLFFNGVGVSFSSPHLMRRVQQDLQDRFPQL